MYQPEHYAIVLAFMIVSMLCWGSWANTLKPSDVLTGSTTEPIIVHMPDADLCVEYYIIYRNHRHHKLAEGANRAHSCPGCGS